jgi:hypothetical protein
MTYAGGSRTFVPSGPALAWVVATSDAIDHEL